MRRFLYTTLVIILIVLGFWLGFSLGTGKNRESRRDVAWRDTQQSGVKRGSLPEKKGNKTLQVVEEPPPPNDWAKLGEWNNKGPTSLFSLRFLQDIEGTKRPVEGVEVTLGVAGSFPPMTTISDVKGIASFQIEPGNAIELYAVKGELSAWSIIDQPDFQRTATDVLLTPAGTLAVEILDADTLPIYNATVVLTKETPIGLVTRELTTDLEGVAHFDGVSSGIYYVAADSDRTPPYTEKISVNVNDFNKLNNTQYVTLTLKRYVSVDGSVSAQGKPVAGAYVAIYSSDGEKEPLPSAIVETDSKGYFSAQQIAEGSIFAIIQSDQYETFKSDVRLVREGSTFFNIELLPKPTLNVRVLDKEGNLIKDADILIIQAISPVDRLLAKTKTNQSGVAELPLSFPRSLVEHGREDILLYAKYGELESPRLPLSHKIVVANKPISLVVERPSPAMQLRIENLPAGTSSVAIKSEKGHCVVTPLADQTEEKLTVEEAVGENPQRRQDYLVKQCRDGRGKLEVVTPLGVVTVPLERIDGANVILPNPEVRRLTVNGPNEEPSIHITSGGVSIPYTLIHQGRESWVYELKGYAGRYVIEASAPQFTTTKREFLIGGKNRRDRSTRKNDSSHSFEWSIELTRLERVKVFVVDKRNAPVYNSLIFIEKKGVYASPITKENPFNLDIPKGEKISLVGIDPQIGWGVLSLKTPLLQDSYYLSLDHSMSTISGAMPGGLFAIKLEAYGIRVYDQVDGIRLEPEYGSEAEKNGVKKGVFFVFAKEVKNGLQLYFRGENGFRSIILHEGEK